MSIYFRSFRFQKNVMCLKRNTGSSLRSLLLGLIVWVIGFVFILKRSIHLKLILQHPQQSFPEYNLIIVHLCMNCCADSRMRQLPDGDSLLPEIVFKNITPRNVITSSVSYLVRFCLKHLDLFHSYELFDSFNASVLIKIRYALLKKVFCVFLNFKLENE